jgi:hypothetical protein
VRAGGGTPQRDAWGRTVAGCRAGGFEAVEIKPDQAAAAGASGGAADGDGAAAAT